MIVGGLFKAFFFIILLMSAKKKSEREGEKDPLMGLVAAIAV